MFQSVLSSLDTIHQVPDADLVEILESLMTCNTKHHVVVYKTGRILASNVLHTYPIAWVKEFVWLCDDCRESL